MRGGAFCVPAKREGARIQWLNGTELTNTCLVLYSFLERGKYMYQAKTLNSAPKSELTLDWHRSTVGRDPDELGADRLKIWRNAAADTIQVTEVDETATSGRETGLTAYGYGGKYGGTGTAPNVLALKSAVY